MLYLENFDFGELEVENRKTVGIFSARQFYPSAELALIIRGDLLSSFSRVSMEMSDPE